MRSPKAHTLLAPLALAAALCPLAPALAAAQYGPLRSAVAISYPQGRTINVRFHGLQRSPEMKAAAQVTRLGRRYTQVVLEVENLPPAYEFGRVYSTYVLWAVSPEGRTDNLGELKREGTRAGDRVEVTTTLESFALIVTAEPHYMMRVPSPMVVLQNMRVSDGVKLSLASYAVNTSGYSGPGALSGEPYSQQAKSAGDAPPASLLGARQAVGLALYAGAQRDAPQELADAVRALDDAEQNSRSGSPESVVDAQARQAIRLGVKAEEAAEIKGATRLRREMFERGIETMRADVERGGSTPLKSQHSRVDNHDWNEGQGVGASGRENKALNNMERAESRESWERAEARESKDHVDRPAGGTRAHDAEAREAAKASKDIAESRMIEESEREKSRGHATKEGRAASPPMSVNAPPSRRADAAPPGDSMRELMSAEKQSKPHYLLGDLPSYRNSESITQMARWLGLGKADALTRDLSHFGTPRATTKGVVLALPDNVWAGARATELTSRADATFDLLGSLLAENRDTRVVVEVPAYGDDPEAARSLANARIAVVAGRLASAGVSGVQADTGGVELRRYPTVECQEVVEEGQELTVQVSLTDDRVTPQVEVRRGADPVEPGRLMFTLPAKRDVPEQDAWKVTVVILAPDFLVLDKSDVAVITLPEEGDSQVVAFHLKSLPNASGAQSSELRVTFWHEGTFLARVARAVAVRRASDAKESGGGNEGVDPPKTEAPGAPEMVKRADKDDEPAPPPVTQTPRPPDSGGGAGTGKRPRVTEFKSTGTNPLTEGLQRILIGSPDKTPDKTPDKISDKTPNKTVTAPAPLVVARGRAERSQTPVVLAQATRPDLTMQVITRLGRNGEAQITIDSPYLLLSNTTFPLPKGADAWINSQYKALAGRSPRDATPEGRTGAQTVTARERMRGFGLELYRRYAPPAFKEAFWKLVRDHGAEFKTIQIYTDNPAIPWELMKPVSDKGVELDFLGVKYAVGRWHVSEVASAFQRPPGVLKLQEFVTVAPQYEGARALPALRQELKSLATFPHFRLMAGNLASLRQLFANMPDGIIHFAGHGSAGVPGGRGEPYFVIELEDGMLDPVMWRGMVAANSGAHPLIFFNACDVGRAERVANFVEGWAPAVLETGASGYIGALWPLGDEGAAHFARLFYDVLGRARVGERSSVSEVLRLTRREYLKNGDPTFLAYVYYGDPNLLLDMR